MAGVEVAVDIELGGNGPFNVASLADDFNASLGFCSTILAVLGEILREFSEGGGGVSR